jgi:hypothetical protein
VGGSDGRNEELISHIIRSQACTVDGKRDVASQSDRQRRDMLTARQAGHPGQRGCTHWQIDWSPWQIGWTHWQIGWTHWQIGCTHRQIRWSPWQIGWTHWQIDWSPWQIGWTHWQIDWSPGR